MNHFQLNFPDSEKHKIDGLKHFIKKYVDDGGIIIKFLNSCSTGFAGVRTKDQVIICSPHNMESIGDFIYTIFHEIRHEEQMTKLQLNNPLSEFDLEDFESLYKEYWNMEIDADQFAKTMIAELIIKLKIPIEVAKKEFKLSPYITNYPNLSEMIKHSLKSLINDIKLMKKNGEKYEDIQDHPIVKKHINNLEKFF
jgi:hypothetical protein